jgi:regulator of protease activity HflC (stomatin/prohibitin superfamily)
MTLLPILEGLAAVIWLAVVGGAGWLAFNAARGRGRVRRPAVIWLVAAALGATLLGAGTAGLIFIEPSERGVLVTALRPNALGAEPLRPGLHWIVPIAERVRVYSIASQNYTLHFEPAAGQPGPIRARTNDGQEVFIAAAVLYAPNPDEVVQLHVDWQDRYPAVVVAPLVSSLLRDAASQYGVEEIVSTQRAAVEAQVTAALREKLAEHHLQLIEFVMHDTRFSPEYAEAVEQKQIAEQSALQAAIRVEQRFQEAEQVRLTAQGQADAVVIAAQGQAAATLRQAQAEAESLALIQAALEQNPQVLDFRYIDQVAPDVSVIYLPGSAPTATPAAP